MAGGDLDREFRLERLRDIQGRRKARERDQAFSLVERGAILLMTAVCLAYALLGHSLVTSIPVFGCGLRGAIALFARRRQ